MFFVGGSKTKFCKCGHEKTLHNKSIFSFNTCCELCACSSFMNKNRPTKTDYVFLYACVSLGIILVSASVLFLVYTDPSLNGTENETIVFSLGQIHSLMSLVFVFFIVFFISWLVIDPFIDIMRMKKRRDFSK